MCARETLQDDRSDAVPSLKLKIKIDKCTPRYHQLDALSELLPSSDRKVTKLDR
jgi:hypothetical protein